MPGDVVITDPVVASWASGRFDVVALGKDYKLNHWWWSGGTINIEQVSSSALGLGPPALVTWGINRLDIFFRGWDRAVYHLSSNGSAPWTLDQPGGEILDFPSAVTTEENTLRVYVRGLNRRLWEVRQTNGGPWAWTSLSTSGCSTDSALSGSPSAAVQGNVVTVYVRTAGGHLASCRLSGGTWSFAKYSHNITDSPTATPGAAFVRGRQGQLLRFDGTTWTSLHGVFD